MSLRRAGRLAAMVLPLVLCLACGQVYRPVVIPCSAGGVPGCPPEPAPTPGSFHAVFGLSTNLPNAPGGAMQIDVAGDSIIAETPTSDQSAPNLGANPTYAAVLPNDSRLFVASAGSVEGGVDAVSYLSPAFQSTQATGFGPVNNVNLPYQASSITAISESGNLVTATLSAPLSTLTNTVGYTVVITNVIIPNCLQPACNPNAYDGAFALVSNSGTTITYSDPSAGLAPGAVGGTATFPPQPVFLNTTQNTAMYVANYNTNSIFAINTTANTVSNTVAYPAVGVHPVSLAELPNGLKIYSANEGDNTVSSLTVQTLTPNVVTVPAGITLTTPVWVVARGDSQKVYVLTEGNTTVEGQLLTIDTATDTINSNPIPVGAGANFLYFDLYLNRLYVANPATSMVYVFSDTGGANDTPVQLAAISFGPGSAACPLGCSPTSVTALTDGSRFYVASYELAVSCPDPFVGASSSCIIPGLTVFDAATITPKISPALTLLTYPPFAADVATNQYQYAVPQVGSCASPVLPAVYAPGDTRFRVFTTSAEDASHVYVSMCDAAAIADINTTDANINGTGGGTTPADSLVTDLSTAVGVCSQTSCNTASTITAFSITNNVVTFQGANQFAAGQQITISGLTTGSYLNNLNLTVLGTGLTSSQFEVDFTYSNVSLTTDSGTAVPLPPLQTPIFLLMGQ
jgi:DNA-binding beta-propeller fold protein YncE